MKSILILSLATLSLALIPSCETDVEVVPVPVSAPRTTVTTEETVTTRSTPYGTVQTQTVQTY
ncbi:hypothetical protein WJU23_00480 [Prosthecobacter sp. SYSU 5D2]|uniref:hypothetical protein n=1 Tax=Prosthecobacter sp. SYSU 5D2 TaxID=3134134 RepID=UPI0031FF3727